MKYIDSQPEFAEAVENLQRFPVIAIDTEFIRESSYFPKLCLIQIACKEQIYVIDALAIKQGILIFDKILDDINIKKVFHSCRQDIEVFYHIFHKIPKNVADTQILSLACGFQQQISYSNLTKAILDIEIPKKSQMSNWDKRPLSEKQIDYAKNDVHYLYQIYQIIEDKLKKMNRQDWCQNEMDKILDEQKINIDTDNAYKKIKFKPKSKLEEVALQKIAKWREEKAIKTNKPRKYILKDQIIKILCQYVPTQENELDDIRIYGNYLKKQSFTKELLEILKDCKANYSDKDTVNLYNKQIQNKPKNNKISPLAMELAMLLLKQIALDAKVNYKLLATADEIRDFLENPNQEFKFSSGWRKKLVYETLVRFRQGQIGLKHENGKMTIIEEENLNTNLNARLEQNIDNKNCLL